MTAIQIKSAMMQDAENWYKSKCIDSFGRLLHMIQDSYAPGHVERDENDNITAFLDADKQSKIDHIKSDNYKNGNGNVKSEAKKAIKATTKLINYYYNNKEWSEVEKYLDTEVLKGVNENTKVGIAGEKFEDNKNDNNK